MIDDGSRDGSGRWAAAAGAEVLRRQAPPGLAAARNAGWRALETPLIACLDADVAPAPGWLGALTDALAGAEPEVAGVGGRLFETGPSLGDRWRAQHLRQDHGPARREVPFLFGAGGLLRRRALEAVGGYDERFTSNAEDFHLGQALRRAGWHLLHEPAATAQHLRRDTITSALAAAWRHRFYGHQRPIGWAGCAASLLVNLRSALSMARRDLAAGRAELLGPDLAFAALASARDLAATWRGRFEAGS